MLEMSCSSKYHRDTMLICSSNGFFITHRTTWLDDTFDACFSSIINTITEWEECIRGHNRTFNH